MDYQKHIKSSFARTKKEIRLDIAFEFPDFDRDPRDATKCRFVTQTKPRNSVDRSHRNPVFSPCSQGRA